MGAVEKRLGRRVAERRKAAGLTQAQLAERLGVTTETVSRLERGAVVPSLARLEAFASALGVDLSDLFRVADRDAHRDRALHRLLAAVRRAPADDIELIADLAERVLGHFDK
ncbi:helix-turn-helix domain-containing protein [Anaeromyxobacter soli]|uniref:helix-turn-helix domain-containing protein n=1 Tax=Anaeromyxobacter soli TaxID=2922725 RepID=UPI001FAEE1CD|nr:helix-turn-helix transcriptional regulator [Anaeromyxobacter sp. SG29]